MFPSENTTIIQTPADISNEIEKGKFIDRHSYLGIQSVRLTQVFKFYLNILSLLQNISVLKEIKL